MKISPCVELQPLYEKAYVESCAMHGNLDLRVADYATHLQMILSQQLQPESSAGEARRVFERLHTSDLYLSLACAQASEPAWRRFATLYQPHLREVARLVCASRQMADELAASAAGYVFLPDRSSRSRIASFDGRSSLAFWLAVIVKRLAIQEHRRKFNHLERLTDLSDLADRQSVDAIGASLRNKRYKTLIRDCLERIGGDLSERERLVLRLRYLQQMKASEIAQLLAVNRSSVTRQLERTHGKLRREIVTLLATRHQLGDAAIAECLAEMLEDPEYSVFAADHLC